MVLNPQKARHASYFYIQGCNSKYDLPQLIDLDKVWIPLDKKGRPANITRPELDEKNVSGLQTGLANGIDY